MDKANLYGDPFYVMVRFVMSKSDQRTWGKLKGKKLLVMQYSLDGEHGNMADSYLHVLNHPENDAIEEMPSLYHRQSFCIKENLTISLTVNNINLSERIAKGEVFI